MSLPNGCPHVTFRFKDTPGHAPSRGDLDECVLDRHVASPESPHQTHDGLTWYDPPEPPKPKRRRRKKYGDDVY